MNQPEEIKFQENTDLKSEIETLKIKLAEAEETINAIQNGDVDAVVVNTGEDRKVFTLEGADYSYRVFVESMDEGAATIVADHSVMYCNERLAKILDTSLENILGKFLDEFIEENSLPSFHSFIDKGFSKTVRGEVNIKTFTGKTIPVLLTFSPVSLHQDAICAIFTDLTELKETQKELEKTNANLEVLVHKRTDALINSINSLKNEIKERSRVEEELVNLNITLQKAERKLELALESGKIGVWEWNMETGELSADKRIESILGFKIDSSNETLCLLEKKVHEEDIYHIRKALNLSLDKGIPLETIVRIKDENDGIKHLNIKAQIYRKDSKPVSMTGVCFDITDMKKGAEEALFKLNEELLRSNKELEQFAYVTSHDLQEPLRMVSSFTQLLYNRYKDKLDEDAIDFIKFSIDGANRMYALINALLEYSRINTRGKEFLKVNMNNVFDNAVFNLSQLIAEKKAIITTDKLPEIYADPGQITQLLQNLIHNSLKFSNRRPYIHLSSTENNEYYIFSLKDNGIGIERQYYEKIFRIFQRLHTKEEYGGTGIGLAICKRITERHGGRIWLESIPGDGSVFYFSIKKPVS